MCDHSRNRKERDVLTITEGLKKNASSPRQQGSSLLHVPLQGFLDAEASSFDNKVQNGHSLSRCPNRSAENVSICSKRP
jgi:hypothetical protein